MSTWDPYDEPEFEGIYEPPVANRPVMSPPASSSTKYASPATLTRPPLNVSPTGQPTGASDSEHAPHGPSSTPTAPARTARGAAKSGPSAGTTTNPKKI